MKSFKSFCYNCAVRDSAIEIVYLKVFENQFFFFTDLMHFKKNKNTTLG